MFGANYFGQPYFAQGYAKTIIITLKEISVTVSTSVTISKLMSVIKLVTKSTSVTIASLQLFGLPRLVKATTRFLNGLLSTKRIT
jgi:hypothetical protein